jgi:hypothetical protein
MSWSVSYGGSLKDARKNVKKQFKSALAYLKVDPKLAEEAVLCELARKLVVRHLKTHPAHLEVAVSAHGHQGNTEVNGPYYQNFTVTCGTVSKP